MVKSILRLCQADPSEFVRRAAVNFVSEWHGTGTALTACLVTMCQALVHDVDFDVKRAAVRFWRQYLPNVKQSIGPSCCQTAVLAGSINCLLAAVSDCDRAVRVEVLTTLVDIQRFVKTQPTLLLPSNHCVAGKLFEDRSCDQICSNLDFINASLRHLPQNFEHELFVDECRSTVAVYCDDDANGDVLPGFTDGDVTYTISRLRDTLLNTNWDSLLNSESEQSDDCHAGNPMSLLDDILKTARRETEVSDENVDGDKHSQDLIIIDCY